MGHFTRNKKFTLTAVGLTAVLSLTACGGGGNSTSADDNAAALLELPSVDTSDGLVIGGETIADKNLYEAAKDREVTYYSGLGGDAEQLLADRFTEETGIKASFSRMPTNKLLERVLSEQGAGKLTAELVRVTDVNAAIELADAGVYTVAESPFNNQFAAQDAVFEDGKFVSGFSSVWGIVYNTQRVAEENIPTNWPDLADPKWNGRIGLTQVSVGGYAASLTDFQLQHYGEEYLEKISANEPRFFDSVAVQTEALARGEIDIAVMGLSNSLALELNGAPVKTVIPEDGMSAGMTPMGLTKAGAENPAAQVFLNWQMSKAGQEFAAAQGFAPTREDVDPTTSGNYEVPAAGTDRLDVFTREEQEERQDEVLKTWNRIFDY